MVKVKLGLAVGLCVLYLGICSCSENSKDSVSPDSSSSSGIAYIGNAPAVFSEINPINIDFKDETGEDPGWVELYNPADTAIYLQGFSLSNSKDEPRKWVFGNAVIPAKSYLIVFLSKTDQPDFSSPSDSTDLIGTGSWSWTDAQSTPPGTSIAEPFAFTEFIGTQESGARAFSGQMQLGEIGDLGWSDACIFLGTGSSNKSDSKDLSKANQLLLTGYLTKGEELEIKLAQPDIDDWKGWSTSIKGTGEVSSTYEITLPTGKTLPDLANIYGIRFDPGENSYDLIQFTFTSIIARNQGHYPHASFQLSKKGGSLFLCDSSGNIRDSVAYPEVQSGKSYTSNGTSWGFADPSPAGSTSGLVYNEIEKNKFSLPSSGFYSTAFDVSFTSNEGESVHCELGGKSPTKTSPIYSGVVNVSSTTVFRCATFKDGALPSDIITRTYIFETAPSIPSIFITADPNQLFDPDSGIYEEGPNAQTAEPHFGANYWKDITIPANIALIETGANAPAFEEDAGFEIFGNYSRANPKKSVAFKFRERYGKTKLEYVLFPEFPKLKEFKDFVLRNNGGNFYTDYIRDRLGSSISKGLGVDYQKGRFVIAFYNGEYFGIHDMRERSNENYFWTNYGYDSESIDLLKADNSASAGSSADFVALENFVNENGVTDSANYAYVASQMDIDNYINYMQTEIYVENRDWPANNSKKWRSESPLTEWKWFLYDLDFGFANGQSSDENIDMFTFITDSTASAWPNGAEYTILFRRLIKNETFKAKFINRFSALIATKFSTTQVTNKINELMSPIESELARDQEKWPLNATYMESSLAQIKDFAKTRPAEILSEMQTFFSLGEVQNVTLSASGCGTIGINGLDLDNLPATVSFFKDLPVTISATETSGCTFTGWSDGIQEKIRVLSPLEGSSYTAIFK
ncbi:MAG: CotH kinase family protein [Fibrobacteraceae bacterium]|nr:CotH kinase family protein [Fibrobacteraceae bacterium]